MSDSQSPRPADVTVSVVIPTYNRAHLIRESVDSILAQTRPPDEIVVVDDGSTDDTADVVASYAARVRYMRKENGGKSAALNFALNSIDSEFVWIFDDDDIALPNALASHLNFLAAHREYDFSYSPQHVFSGKFSLEDINARRKPTLPEVSSGEFFVRTMESMHSMMQGMLVPRRCYEQVGPFNETFIRAQDHEMLLRLARRFSGGCLNEPTFALRMHEGIRGSASNSHSESNRARIWQEYRQKIFEALRNDLNLAEYLPDVANDAVLSPLQSRQALAQRFCIMARNATEDQAIEDYRHWRKALGTAAPTHFEQLRLSRAVQVDDMEIVPSPAFFWRIGRASGRHSGLLKPLARGLHWAVAREFRSRKLFNIARLCLLNITLSAGLVAGSGRYK